MRHLVKIAALIFALFSLASCSRTPGSSSDEFGNPIVFDGGVTILVKEQRWYTSYTNKNYYTYELDGIYKHFSIRALEDERIKEIEYLIEFDYVLEDSPYPHKVRRSTYDWLGTQNYKVNFNGHKLSVGGEPIEKNISSRVRGFYDGTVTLAIHTTSGNVYRKTLYNVPIQLN